jgi:pterin-4a-carbinolamine dehydratase
VIKAQAAGSKSRVIHSYTQMVTSDSPPPKPKREFSTAREAGEAHAAQRKRTGITQSPVEEIAYRDPSNGKIVDERETVTLNRAADDLKGHRDAQAQMVDAIDTFDVADKVDQARADAGLAADVAAEPSQPQLEQVDPAADQFERDAVAAGVDPALAKVLQHPQARQALESEFKKVEHLQSQHSIQIQLAQHFAREAWQSQFSELAGLSPDQAGAALARMRQTNPARFQQAMASLQRVSDMAAASEHHAAQRAHAERQQFQALAVHEDAQFDRWTAHQTPAQKSAIGREVLSYAAEMGIDRNTFVNLMQTNPIMRSAQMQRVFSDAATLRMIRREGYRDKVDRSLPPVQRPGTSSGARTSNHNANLTAAAKKAASSGSLRDMANLLIEKRKGR